MPVALRTHAVGTVWANMAHEKCIVLAHDDVGDQVLIYNYLQHREQFIDRREFDDNRGFIRPWDEHMAYERGVFDGLVSPLITGIQGAFSEGIDNEDGPPMACFREEQEDGDHAFEYGTYFLGALLKTINRGSLLSIASEFEAVIRHDVRMHRFSRIVWRTYPEMDIQHSAITGERKIKLYARFAAFSGTKYIEPKLLAGNPNEGRLT